VLIGMVGFTIPADARMTRQPLPEEYRTVKKRLRGEKTDIFDCRRDF
jgi:hypothetical protein